MISLRPSAFTQGGGLHDDIDVRVTASTFLMYDYGGKSDRGAVPALGFTVVDNDNNSYDEYLSCGKPEDFYPSKDDKNKAPEADASGDYLLAVGSKTGINGNTNLAIFLTSLVNAGYPEDKLDNFKASDIIGLEFHLKREAIKRTGLVRTGQNANREQSVLTASKINRLPWEAPKPTAPASKAAVGGKTNGAAKNTAPAPPPPTGDLAAKAEETLIAYLMENGGGPIAKAKAATGCFASLKGDPDQATISKMLYNSAVLEGMTGIAFDGAAVRLAE